MARNINTGRTSAPAPSGGPSVGIPKKATLLTYAVTLVLAVACRCQQLLTNVNFNTGRYIDNNIFKNTTMFVIIIGMLVTAFLLLFGKAKDKVIKSCILINPWRLRYDRLNAKMPKKAAYSCLLMAFLVVLQVILDIAQTISFNKQIRSGMDEKEAKHYSLLTGTTAMDIVMGAVMFFVFLTFLTMAINIFKGDGISRANCAALNFFALWKVLEIFEMFSNNNIIAVSSEKVYILLSNMAATVFFIQTSRFFLGLEKKFTRFWMCMMGYLASVLSAVSVIPRYIMLVTEAGYDDRLGMGIPNISDIGIAFTTITIVAVFWGAYAYRVMPKISDSGRKRWMMNARPKDTDMKSLDIKQGDL